MNLKVLIVEDESLTRKVLMKQVAQILPGAEITGVRSSSDFLSAAQKLCPDIFLVDINIPGELNGMEIIEKIHDEHPLAKFVITTAYDTFSFAKKAISLGCTDYLLKPVQEKELAAVLNQCVKEIESERQKTNDLFSLSLTRDYHMSEVFSLLKRGEMFENPLFSIYGWPKKSFSSPVFYLRFVSEKSMDSDSIPDIVHTFHGKYIYIRENLEYKILLYFEGSSLTAAQTYLYLAVNHLHNIADCRFILSSPCYSYEEILEHFRKTERLSLASYQSDLSYIPLKKIRLRPLSLPEEYDKQRQRLVQRLRENHAARAISLVERFQEKQSHDAALFLLVECMLQMGLPASELLPFVSGPKEELISSLISYMTEHCIDSQDSPNNELVTMVLEYMKLHCDQPLSLSETAESVGLNPSYLSRMFKKKNGISFVDTLTKFRIQKAQTLLVTTDLSIDEISERCGYNTAKYFRKIFLTQTGVSAVQYRKEHSLP